MVGQLSQVLGAVDRTRAALSAAGKPELAPRLVFLYVSEAHPSDGWRFERNAEVARHRSPEDRLAALARLQAMVPELAGEVAVTDNLKDTLMTAFGCRNAGIVVIEEGVCRLENKTDTPDAFKPSRLAKWLKARFPDV